MRPLALSALLLATATAAPAQEAVLLRIGGTPGRPVHSRMVMAMFMRGSAFDAMGGDTSLPTMRIQMSFTQTLDSVIGDTLVFSSTIDSASAESPGVPGLSAMLQTALASAPKRGTTRMDSRGRLMGVDLGATGGPGAPAGLPMGGPGGGFSPSGASYSLPEQPVRVGETWTSMTNVSGLPGGMSVTGRTEYRLERIDPRGSAGTAVIAMRGTMSMPEPMSGEVAEVPLVGVLRLDIAARRITAMATVVAYAAMSPAGEVRGRVEMTQAEDGETAPALPMLPPPTPAIPSKPATPPGSPPPAPPKGR